MLVPRLRRLDLVARGAILTLACASGLACASPRLADWSTIARHAHKPDDQIRLADAEQMIDELDRTLTTNGTIGVKSPDVWGQDRLTKFRSEYETQMSEWLKQAYKGEINASTRRNEAENRRLQLATGPTEGAAKEAAARLPSGAEAAAKDLPGLAAAMLEPTVVLDEHSNYLNHLNQLRRVNAGDDLADRPGYGLYLVRIPVTLSPGPKSRRGKGAIITVSARSNMSKDTLRLTLRSAVINETVNNLTQAISNDPAEHGDPAVGRGTGAFSLVAYADSEILYGKPGIAMLKAEAERQLARELADEPHHRTARISDWLKGELESSYHLLEQAATPVRAAGLVAVADPLEEVGDLMAARDYVRLARLQSLESLDPTVAKAGGLDEGTPRDEVSDDAACRRRVSAMLGFALRIQAAAVNRRLKQDMSDQDPKLTRDELRAFSFFEPSATDEAMRLFEKYVQAKWPLRVYAIEPVIAQQNVADALGRRMLSAFDLIASGPVGPFKALGGLSADRRTADDETAIRLNPTMVGFGAGESTFGWIFYPRVQTDRGGQGRLLGNLTLLLNGRYPDHGAKEQSIEPGQRECTALIEMPNFIPKIEFVTVANWFRTSDIGDGQKSDLERASYLASKLVAAEEALKNAMVAGKYREEEMRIAQERLNQIRSMMPTQRLVVRVPFTADGNDARIFCSQSDQLRPALQGWHGRPPEEGGESSLFLEGKNFSVHDTHVLAGGRPAKSVLVSRNLLEITIAPDATPTPSKDGRPLLDVNVATPNGVSNHLLIPMSPARLDRKASPGERSEAPKADKVPTKPADSKHPAVPTPPTDSAVRQARGPSK